MEIGTTPTHSFNIPKDIYEKIKDVQIVYSQNNNIILKKRKNDFGVSLKDGKITVRLTQEETFKFDETKNFVNIQIRVLTVGNDCFKSKVIVDTVGRCLDKEVLV